MVKKFLRRTNSLLLATAMTVTLMPMQMVSAAPDYTAASAVLLQADERAASALDVSSITGKEYTVIKGNTPILPKKAITSTNGAPVEIQWAGLDQSLEVGKHTITGTAGQSQLSVTVNVLPCDEAVENVTAMGMQDSSTEEKANAIHPLKGYKGLFVTEYDIVPNNVKSTHDRAVIYLPEAMNDGTALHAENCWDTGARLQFKYNHDEVTYFQTQDGDGQVVGNARYFPTNEELDYALDNNQAIEALSFDETSTYHVRTVIDTATDKTKGNYKIYITDPDGIEHEVTKKNGNGFRIYPKDGIVKNFAAVRGSYSLINHKISWISGYATKKTEIYLKASNDADYVKESQDVITKELPGTIAAQPDAELVKDGLTYTLDAEKSGWYNGENKVSSVTAQEGETVTYRAYYKIEKTQEQIETEEAKTAMESSVTAAEQKLTEIKESDYTPISWKTFQDALQACKALNPETASKADYVSKKEALDFAMEGLTKQADKAALNQAITEAKSKKESDYEAAGYKEMQAKLTAAQTAADNPNAAQSEVDTAKDDLLNAISKLVKKPTTIKVKSIKPAAKTYKIAAGKKLTVKNLFTVSPKNATNKKLNYSIDKKYSKYASIKSGVVTVKKAGAGKTIAVKATAADGSKKTATIKVKIMKHAVTKIKVKNTKITVKAGKKATIKPVITTNGKSANKTLSYTSSNEKLATVKNGVVTTKKGKTGKVTITIKSTDGTNKSVKVKVTIKK